MLTAIVAWVVVFVCLVGLGAISLGWFRRRYPGWRIDRRRYDRRDWRAYIERRYRKP